MTSTNASTEINASDAESNQDTYGYIESQGYKKLFEFIRFDSLENPRLITMVELLDYMHSPSVAELRESTKTGADLGEGPDGPCPPPPPFAGIFVRDLQENDWKPH